MGHFSGTETYWDGYSAWPFFIPKEPHQSQQRTRKVAYFFTLKRTKTGRRNGLLPKPNWTTYIRSDTLKIGDDARKASKDAKDACRLEGAVDELRSRWMTRPLWPGSSVRCSRSTWRLRGHRTAFRSSAMKPRSRASTGNEPNGVILAAPPRSVPSPPQPGSPCQSDPRCSAGCQPHRPNRSGR